MGMVAMESRTVGYDRGYPILEAALYVYCDTCGSFNVKTYIPVSKPLAAVVVLLAAVLLVLKDQQWMLCFIPLGVLALLLPWRDILLRYKCRKCSSTQITDYNVLNYEPHDMSAVDVQNRLIQKRYIDHDDPGFWRYT
jgi:hypothetical protein